MRISTKADYALRALIEIARVEDARPITAEELSRRQDIPHGFLQSILADLRRADIVVAQRGQAGGWRLARSAESYSVADVIRAVDGPLVSAQGMRPEAVKYNQSAAVLQPVWIAVRHALREVLEYVTVAELAEGKLPSVVTERVAYEDAWKPR